MKKHSVIAMLLVLTLLLVGQSSLFLTSAAADYDPCEVGEHFYDYRGSEPAGYGGTRYFTVSSCAYASYAHKHYYITYQLRHYYDCRYCGYTKVVTLTYDDTELGPICTMHDVGKR